MFEDSLVESRVGQVSLSKRWTMLASISLQVAVAGVVMVLPLLASGGYAVSDGGAEGGDASDAGASGAGG